MKNQLFFNFTKILFRNIQIRTAVYAVLFLLSVQSSFAQSSWLGTTSDFLTGSNWNPALTFSATDAFTIPSGMPNSPLLSLAYPAANNTCSYINIASGATLTTNADITTSSTSTSVNNINGTLNINAGTYKSRFYMGLSGGSGAAIINVATGASLIGSGVCTLGQTLSASHQINVNGGTFTMLTGTNLNIGTTSGRKGFLNLNSGLVQILVTTTLSLSTTVGNGNINVAGGSFEYNPVNLNVNAGVINITAGSFKLLNSTPTINATSASVGTTTAGLINIAGGTLDASGSLAIGNSGAVGLVTVNLNSGTMNVAGALTISQYLGSYTGLLNIDAGSIVLTGNQTAGIATLITAGKITVSGAALAAGKVISNTYDAATNKTTVTAVSAVVPSTTWTGSWSNGTPNATTEVVIEGTYSTTTNGSFNAKKLTVNSGSLTINSGTIITVQNEVVNNAGTNGIVVENNANLNQVNNTINTGNVVVNRNSNALYRLDYTMWSSPVAGQNLATFSPLTSQNPSRFYTYDSAAGAYSQILAPTTTTFTNGTGYLIRMPNDASATTATAYPGIFTGVPNNGTVTLSGLTAEKFYAVGNPYPSTLSANAFINGNATGGTLYFWRKTNGIANSGSAYASYTTLGGTAGSNVAPNNVAPNGTIQVGQGFIVKTGAAATTLTFTNAMRTANNSNQIFRTKNVDQKDRVWLNLTNTAGVFSQTLVGYMDGATQAVDAGIDGAYINDSAIALTSVINGEDYTIQGRPAFEATDVVPLNFKTDVAGDYTIAIDHADGVFTAGQDVYLVDSTTGTETNLKTDAYTFSATTGTANSRFSLKYQKTLKVDAPAFNDNSVTVYKNNGTLYVNSGASAISNIKVFDIQGRVIAEQKNVNANATVLKNLNASQQVLIVKVTAQDNTVVTKKVVN